MTLLNTLARRHRVQSTVTCPHCWQEFPPENMLWIASHQDLKIDRKLPGSALRFLPTRFDAMGNALDAKDFPCDGLACPQCHLPIHRGLVEIEPLFCSIIGTPSCGKSYYLATLIHQMRQNAFKDHFLQFGDLDPASNDYLIDMEEKLFLSPETQTKNALGELVAKTGDKVGDAPQLYNRVRYGDQEVVYTKPYMYLLTLRQHEAVKSLKNTTSRVLCLYDNAGEHYLALTDNDSVSNQVTRHLAKSKFLFFLFDPSQDVRFWKWAIEQWEAKLENKQRVEEIKQLASNRRFRQDTVLQEAAGRVRRLLGLGQQKKHQRHLIIIVTKADLWAEHLGINIEQEPVLQERDVKVGKEVIAQFRELDDARIQEVSQKLKEHMRKYCPDLVLAAENFCEEVTYIPVSALGNRPEFKQIEVQGKSENIAAIQLSDIQPRWVTIPLIYALHEYAPQLMLKVRKKPPRNGVAS